ncbi:hypothetical protein E2C01_074086 [Portunus trituberculatus]|uniref:Uncharacterized protein n=1 Tax=Portunus trituberculatus TaxID=210409 RepID=A0A5B7IBG2_PORTR|nr:hypothetical protein [Portunus trituberculatus]
MKKALLANQDNFVILELSNSILDQHTRQNIFAVPTCVTAGTQDAEGDALTVAAAAAALQIHGTGDRNATW